MANHETLNSPEVYGVLRSRIRGTLVGEGSPRREELKSISEFQLNKTDIKSVLSLGLELKREVIEQLQPTEQRLIAEHLSNLTETILNAGTQEQSDAAQAAQMIVENPVYVTLARFPRESLAYRVAAIVLALMIGLSMSVLTSKEAKAQLPTVTPTPVLTPEAKTPTPQATKAEKEEEEESVLPTTTPTPTATPRSTRSITETAKITATPEITVTPEIIKEYAVVLRDGTNFRPDPSTNNPPVYIASAGERLELTGENEEVGEYVWHEVYISNNSANETQTTTAWVREDLITIEEEVSAPSEPETTVITNTETGIGGNLTQEQINEGAIELFGPRITVELNQEGTHPVAKDGTFVVGEFLNGEWQHIEEITILSEEVLSYYPDVTEKEIDGKSVLVQNTFGVDVVIAEKTVDGKWAQPSMSSWELTQMAKDLGVTSVAGPSRDREGVASQQPYGYHITEAPLFQFQNGEIVTLHDFRSLVVRGMVVTPPEVIHLPILKEENNKQVPTGWSARFIFIRLASVDYNGRWFTNNLIVGATTPLVSPDGKIYGHKYNPDDTEIPDDSLSYSRIQAPFSEFNFSSTNFPLFEVSDIITDIEPGSAVGVYVNAITSGDPDSFQENAQFLASLYEGFNLEEDSDPTDDQIFGFITAQTYRFDPRYSISNYFLPTDQDILEITENGGAQKESEDPIFWGNVSAVHSINTSAR